MTFGDFIVSKQVGFQAFFVRPKWDSSEINLNLTGVYQPIGPPQVDGIAVYIGFMSAQVIQGHPKSHLESKMHGGVRIEDHRDHVVIALFDNKTGKRISDAQVTAAVTEFGMGSQRKKMQPMDIADKVTYGNYFDFPDKNQYHVQVWIKRPNWPNTLEARFTHSHL